MSVKSLLESIAALGGNLPDDRLEGRTGANDAAHRGLMYTAFDAYAARRCATEALPLLAEELEQAYLRGSDLNRIRIALDILRPVLLEEELVLKAEQALRKAKRGIEERGER